MPYCNKHHTNNCIECAIESQTIMITSAIVDATRIVTSTQKKLESKVRGLDLILWLASVIIVSALATYVIQVISHE